MIRPAAQPFQPVQPKRPLAAPTSEADLSHDQATPTVCIEERVFRLPFLEEVRPLTDAELARLRESIRADGIQAPVLVDEEDSVLDGANRLQIAEELGLPLERVPLQRVT